MFSRQLSSFLRLFLLPPLPKERYRGLTPRIFFILYSYLIRFSSIFCGVNIFCTTKFKDKDVVAQCYWINHLEIMIQNVYQTYSILKKIKIELEQSSIMKVTAAMQLAENCLNNFFRLIINLFVILSSRGRSQITWGNFGDFLTPSLRLVRHCEILLGTLSLPSISREIFQNEYF